MVHKKKPNKHLDTLIFILMQQNKQIYKKKMRQKNFTSQAQPFFPKYKTVL